MLRWIRGLPFILALAFEAWAQAPTALSGTFLARDGSGRLYAEGSFSCSGTDPCVGTYAATAYPMGCSNPTLSADQMMVTGGAGLARPGSFNARVVLKNALTFDMQQPGGTCVVTSRRDLILDVEGLWDGSSASLVLPPRDLGAPSPLTISLSLRSAAPPPSSTYAVNGSFSSRYTEQGVPGSFEGTFGCSGEPVCVGTYTSRELAPRCSNTWVLTEALRITGFDLSRPGPLQGQITLGKFDFDDTINNDGTCTIQAATMTDATLAYTGQWDGSAGSLTFTFDWGGSGYQATFNATFTANRSAPPPVFPMTVSSRIDSSASATATFQPRPQEAGTTQSVFVFAVAPRDLVRPATAADAMPPLAKARGKGIEAKADAVACVLAQLNAAGQLVAVSPASLQAFVTGVLSAQGQSVTIMNNVPTINVAGTTFYVGYGANGPAMIASGVNRNALTVPGARECRPQPPQTGWWWDPPPTAGARSPRDGTGYSIEAQGNALFFAAFLYDASGRSSWYVASGRTSVDGSLFTGDLLQASGGQTLGGAYRPFSSVANAGPITLAFDSATTGTMVWPGGTVPLGRFNIVPNGLAALPRSNQPEAGWWWNPQESGRGFFIEWQDGTADLAGYMYDDAGNPVWYITVVPTPDPMRLTGTWLSFGNGMTLTGPWQPHQLVNPNVAPVTVTFTSATTATMTLPNGRTTNLVRHRF